MVVWIWRYVFAGCVVALYMVLRYSNTLPEQYWRTSRFWCELVVAAVFWPFTLAALLLST